MTLPYKTGEAALRKWGVPRGKAGLQKSAWNGFPFQAVFDYSSKSSSAGVDFFRYSTTATA